MKTNRKFIENVYNQVGTSVRKISSEQQLRRVVMASMLWEDQFYVDGDTSAAAIARLVPEVQPEKVAEIAVQARTEQNLRHVPLLLARELARIGKLQANTLVDIIQRADEMSEFLSIYWKDGKTAIANQVKKGLAKAFHKFNEYQLAKFDHNNAAVSLRDVMFLTHVRPQNEAEEDLYRRLANKQLKTPDTWETNLSAGADKADTFLRLMNENKLGALAFLRNLRGMITAGVPEVAIREYAKGINLEKVLPFRFITAARHNPALEDMLEDMMLRSCAEMPKLLGKTILLVDVSGSMFGCPISRKSELDRFDAAAALAMLARETCENVEIYTFSDRIVRVQPRRGFALADALRTSQPHGSTRLGNAINTINMSSSYDRVIVFTDEQSYDMPPAPKGKGYILNVAAYENGINHSSYTTINGFSEACLSYIRESENESCLSPNMKWPFPMDRPE